MKHSIFRFILCLSMITLPIMTITSLAHDPQHVITAEISVGELIDKITILEIKMRHIQDTEKLRNITTELESLRAIYVTHITPSAYIQALIEELRTANQKLWDVEDALRDKEREQHFDEEFIMLARSVYYTNDARGKVKRALNDLLGSRIVEEKSYTHYAPIAQ